MPEMKQVRKDGLRKKEMSADHKRILDVGDAVTPCAYIFLDESGNFDFGAQNPERQLEHVPVDRLFYRHGFR